MTERSNGGDSGGRSIVDLTQGEEDEKLPTTPQWKSTQKGLVLSPAPTSIQSRLRAWQEYIETREDTSFTVSDPASSFPKEHEEEGAKLRSESLISAAPTYQPSLAGISTIFDGQPDLEIVDLTRVSEKPEKKILPKHPITPQKPVKPNVLPTPPQTNKSSNKAAPIKRVRPASPSRLPAGFAFKRQKSDHTLKNSVKSDVDDNTACNLDIDEQEQEVNAPDRKFSTAGFVIPPPITLSSTPSKPFRAPPTLPGDVLDPQPDKLIDRRAVIHPDGHPHHDPSIFSTKPFHWTKWTGPDYVALSNYIMRKVNAEEFARERTNKNKSGRVFTTEEVDHVLRAVVTRPLRILRESMKRGEKGMEELEWYYKTYGTPIRVWARGTQYQVRGELAGIKNKCVVLMIETPPEPEEKFDSEATKMNVQANPNLGPNGNAHIPIGALTTEDWKELDDGLSENDTRAMIVWRDEEGLGPELQGPNLKTEVLDLTDE
ncbi:hypothetical protein NA57DRAFT_74082 [Rhizodiscina lignyota]|uniref:Uncharacterized protein n=1 Tax=Rhizodiscina lignyota TaxID=1504668 RepID=A0A9P4II91_9PEZI|nr:hypothetical protein NA57DRAFT_74082 [Rhizodiscina lignyota]